jgi:AcrR family transcriptional regulator
VTRTYRSPRRALQAQQTRAAVLAACRSLFAVHGWAATGVRDVAAAAEVSVETVYATLGGKVALLTAALDGAVAGDDEPIPLSERPAFLAMGEGGFDERVTAAAALITDIHVRTIGLQRALREGAGGEPALAELLTTQEENRRTSTGLGIALVLGRPVDDRERDLFWAQTSPEVYDALVNRSGWSTEDYATWVASLIENLKGELCGRTKTGPPIRG